MTHASEWPAEGKVNRYCRERVDQVTWQTAHAGSFIVDDPAAGDF